MAGSESAFLKSSRRPRTSRMTGTSRTPFDAAGRIRTTRSASRSGLLWSAFRATGRTLSTPRSKVDSPPLPRAALPDNPYTPLHARATHAPKPWGVTALFAEYTGNHPPLAIDWTLERKASPLVGVQGSGNDAAQTDDSELEIGSPPVADVAVPAVAAAAPRQTVDVRKVTPAPPRPGHIVVWQPLGVRRRRQPRRSRGTRPGGRWREV